jgi:DNA invertase Pin-like site-specific DNA recombinase
VKRAPKPTHGVAAYVRVSSETQDAAMQRSAIERASLARGDVISVWLDEKRSARTMKRPVLDQLRQLVREGVIRRVYVWRLDRLCRSGIRDMLDLVDELRRHGCELVSLTDGFDLSGPAAEGLLAMMAFCAKLEHVAITERRAAARERILAEGGTWGRPRRTSAATETRVHSLYEQGRTVREISAALKIPRATVGRCLKRPPPNGAAPAAKKRARRSSVPPTAQ